MALNINRREGDEGDNAEQGGDERRGKAEPEKCHCGGCRRDELDDQIAQADGLAAMAAMAALKEP